MFIKELFEERSYSIMNPKTPAYELLKPYSDNPDIFITFTNVEKLGLYPLADDGGTPLGIYAFPLKETWQKYKVDHYGGFELYPEIAHNKEHVLVLKHNKRGGHFINGLSNYTEETYREDFEKLDHMYHREISFIDGAEFEDHHPFKRMYKLTRILADGKPNHWNHIWRYLGYAGLNDSEGTGMIHYAEPFQTVFFSKEPVTLLKSIHYKNYDDAEHLKSADPRKMTAEQMYDIVRDNNRRIQKFEPYIMRDPVVAAKYAWRFRKSEWHNAEPYIIKNPNAAAVYAINVLKRRWPAAESVIKHSLVWERYKDTFNL
jgi:hypothetical protein